jgi:ferredoxin-thioredoxin reductase catalytic subunit
MDRRASYQLSEREARGGKYCLDCESFWKSRIYFVMFTNSHTGICICKKPEENRENIRWELKVNCPCTYREGKFLAPGSIIVGEGKTIT